MPHVQKVSCAVSRGGDKLRVRERTVQACAEIRWVRTERQKLAVGLNLVLTFGLSGLCE